MADEDGLLDRLKKEAFGKLADDVKVEEVGSGISQTRKFKVNLAKYVDGRDLKQPAWSENQALIEKLFTPIFQRSRTCPGRDKTQCCQAEPGEPCWPKWMEREDPEWYALEINKYLSLVNQRLESVTPATAALAADEAFELGCLFTEALIKFQWDAHAKRGKRTLDSASEGGALKRNANRKRLDSEATVAAVDDLLDKGLAKMVAYWRVGEAQGVSDQTIGKEYRAYKKER